MEGNGVEVQIKRATASKTKFTHGANPKPEYFGVAGWINPAAVFGEKRTLRCAVEAGKKGEALIEHIAHDMAVTGVTEEF